MVLPRRRAMGEQRVVHEQLPRAANAKYDRRLFARPRRQRSLRPEGEQSLDSGKRCVASVLSLVEEREERPAAARFASAWHRRS